MNGVPLWRSPEALHSKFAMFAQNSFYENKSANCLPEGNGLNLRPFFTELASNRKGFHGPWQTVNVLNS